MDLAFALRAFVRTIDRGSMSAAARDLGVSQPAVSKLLRNLESHAGARLLERNPRALRPTPGGRVLYEASGGALGAIDAALESVRGEDGVLSGELRLHAPVCLGESRLARIVMAFQERHPRVSVRLTLENRAADLIREDVDLGLRMGRPETNGIVLRRIGLVRRVLVAAPAYLARRGPVADRAALAGHDTLVTDTVLARDGTLRLVRDGAVAAVAVRPILTANNASVVLDAARAGRGIGTAQLQLVVDDLDAGRLVRVLPEDEIVPTELYLTYPSARLLRPAVRAFIDSAVPALRAIPGLAPDEALPA